MKMIFNRQQSQGALPRYYVRYNCTPVCFWPQSDREKPRQGMTNENAVTMSRQDLDSGRKREWAPEDGLCASVCWQERQKA